MIKNKLSSKIKEQISKLIYDTKLASIQLSKAGSEEKNQLLNEISKQIQNNKDYILEANNKDMSEIIPDNFTPAFLDRLRLNDKRINEMTKHINDVVPLKDPVGNREFLYKRPNGIDVYKQSIPIGLIGIIY